VSMAAPRSVTLVARRRDQNRIWTRIALAGLALQSRRAPARRGGTSGADPGGDRSVDRPLARCARAAADTDTDRAGGANRA
jgi:hypothetical protein